MLRGTARVLMLKIDDSSDADRRFAIAVATTTRWRLLVVLAPPLLSELACRLLARSDIEVVVAGPDGVLPPGERYDGAVRNVALRPDVAVSLVVDLPSAEGPRSGAPAGPEVVVLERLSDVVELLARRWPAGAEVS